MDDLWPDDLREVTIRAPVMILREQAAKLGAKTKNVVKARVADADPLVAMKNNYQVFRYSFEITSPTVSGYRFKLFDATHDELLYPVRLYLNAEVAKELEVAAGDPAIAQDEEELTDVLSRIFSAGKTRQVVHALLAQSNTPRAPQGL